MKFFKFNLCILIILFKTGNVLSDNNIFNVNNIEINKEISKNKEYLADQAFKKGFKELLNRLLLEDDHKKIANTSLNQIKKLISYYQIVASDNKNNDKKIKKFNIFFDKDSMHSFFYEKKILYSDIINTEVIFFPLLIEEKKYFIYTKNYFYENWNQEKIDSSIQYTLPLENIENIQNIKATKDNIYDLNIENFFQEYPVENLVFVSIEIKKNVAKIFLNTKISGKKLNKALTINNTDFNNENFNNNIILQIKNEIRDLIKSQNLIDVRTPSFLNVKIKIKNSNLIVFNEKLNKIDLIDNFYIQQLNKDYVLIKIKYLGKISKIINKLKNQNIELKLIKGQWQLNII